MNCLAMSLTTNSRWVEAGHSEEQPLFYKIAITAGITLSKYATAFMSLAVANNSKATLSDRDLKEVFIRLPHEKHPRPQVFIENTENFYTAALTAVRNLLSRMKAAFGQTFAFFKRSLNRLLTYFSSHRLQNEASKDMQGKPLSPFYYGDPDLSCRSFQAKSSPQGNQATRVEKNITGGAKSSSYKEIFQKLEVAIMSKVLPFRRPVKQPEPQQEPMRRAA